MTRVKYDVSDVEPQEDREPPKAGVYTAKIDEIETGQSRQGNNMLTVKFVLTNKENKGYPLWHYIVLDESSEWKLREFTDAMGLKPKGTIDTVKLVGDACRVRTKIEHDEEYGSKPRVASVLSADEDGDDDEDYADMDLDDLREEAESRELSAKGSKNAIIKRLEADDEEGDDGDDDDGDDDDVDYDDMSVSDLRAEAKERGIKSSGSKSALIERLGEDDESGDDDEDDDDDDDGYDDMELSELKEECKERDLKAVGRKSALIKRLREDDESDDPFEDD